MSKRLEDQVRLYAESLYDRAQPIEQLIPPAMAETFEIDQETFQLTATLAPASRRRRLTGWAMSLAAAVAVLLVSVPTVLLINHSQDSAAAPEITIEGAGTVIFESEVAQQPQTMTFTVQVSTNGPATGDDIPAAGPVEITIKAAGETWQIEGDAVCIRDLSEKTTGMWEVRFSTTASTRPELTTGQYGSLYLKNDPIGDKAGGLLGTPDRDNPSCGPRAGAQLAPLDTGAINITN